MDSLGNTRILLGLASFGFATILAYSVVSGPRLSGLLLHIFSRSPSTKLSAVPHEGWIGTTAVLFLAIVSKPLLKTLGLVPAVRPTPDGNGFDLPSLTLSMPLRITKTDVNLYHTAASQGAKETILSPDSCVPNEPLFLLSAATNPMLLMLLARTACPIAPIGGVNVRNRFEFLDPRRAREAYATTTMRAEARTEQRGRRVKRGMEADFVMEVYVPSGEAKDGQEVLIFRQTMTILQSLPRTAKPLFTDTTTDTGRVATSTTPATLDAELHLNVAFDAPSRWAAICQDYNPIHISSLAAKMFGFPGKIAHGNLVVGMMMEAARLSEHAKASRELWWESDKASWLEVNFRRPMVLPTRLDVVVESKDAGRELVIKVQKDKLYVDGRAGWL